MVRMAGTPRPGSGTDLGSWPRRTGRMTLWQFRCHPAGSLASNHTSSGGHPPPRGTEVAQAVRKRSNKVRRGSKKKKKKRERERMKRRTLFRNHFVFMVGRVNLLLMVLRAANSTRLTNIRLAKELLFWRTAASTFMFMLGISMKQKEIVSM